MTSVATETVPTSKPTFGVNGISPQKELDAAEVANLKRQLAAADSATGEAMKRLNASEKELSVATDKLNRVEKELKKLKKIISIMQESGKLDAKKFAAAEKFVSEFFDG